MPITSKWVEEYVRTEMEKLRNDLRLPPAGHIRASDPAPRLSTADDFTCHGCNTHGANWFRTVYGDVICTTCGWSKRLQRALDEVKVQQGIVANFIQAAHGKKALGECTIQELISEAHSRLK